MSGRIEFFGSQKEPTSKWSKNSRMSVREVGVDIGESYQGGSGTNDYNDLINLPKVNDVTLRGNKDSESDLGIEEGEALTTAQLNHLLSIIN